MKNFRILAIVLSIFFSAKLLQAQSSENPYRVVRGERPPIDLRNVSEDAIEQGVVMIKFAEKHARHFSEHSYSRSADGSIAFGIAEVDAFLAKHEIRECENVFRATATKGGFTERHKAWGFHLWFKLRLDEKVDILSLVSEFNKLNDIEIAEPEYKKVHIWKNENQEAATDGITTPARNGWTPNDPMFNQQWHYHNTGQNGGQPGADIDLLSAWDIEKGNPNVIVAIIDDGIDFNHPDLAANMWAGIGYNFVDNNTTILPGMHGTHVAGTVAAVNNNGIGVAGIAGGSGSGDGVRLMSCQVFRETGGGQYLSGGFEEAFIYAADQGAAIAQNSWAYVQAYAYNLSVMDAIDYFILNGGGNAITDGGIVIFAAGNSNSPAPTYPAAYSEVIGVASTDRMDTKSGFSNYGHWVSISAPGSDVFSTGMNNAYTFANGTSMACPHVSGVAALVVSKAYGQFIANEIEEILLHTTDNHYANNPDFVGKLGTGRLNAYQALLETNASLNNNANPASFIANGIDPNTIMLGWVNNRNNDDIIIAWDLQSIGGQPVNGSNYVAGQLLPGGGNVLFAGQASQYEHTGLSPSTKYHYKIWAKNNLEEYSSGRNSEATTFTCFSESQCNYTFRLTTLGSGSWADSYMTVEQGGRIIKELYKFCGTAFYDVEVPLCENTSYQLIWHPGTWGDMMGIEIIGPFGNSIFKRPPQSPNPINHPLLFEGLTDCNTPSCFAPVGIEVSDHQTTQVTVQWTAVNNVQLFNLEYGLLGFQPGTGTLIPGISQSPYNLSGLTPGTRYELRLQADCDEGDLSFWSLPIYFETFCTAFNVPFFEDFTNIPYRHIPTCWERYGSVEIPDYNWEVWGHDHVWLWHNTGIHTNLVSPYFSQNLNQLRVSFDLTWNLYRGNLQIGTTHYDHDGYVFTPLASFPSRLMYDFEPAKRQVVYFDEYSGDDQQIAFRLGAEDATNPSWVFIDNILIEVAPSCPEPYNLIIDNLTATTAQLNWAQAGTVQEWEIKLGEIGFDPDAEGFIISGIMSNTFVINNLVPATFYQVYVRAICGVENSIWSEPVVFSSHPELLSLPHIENFNDCPVTYLPPGWRNLGVGMYNAVVLDGWGTNQSHGAILRHSYFESTSILVAPAFETPIENIKLSFTAWAYEVNFNIEVGVLQNINDIHSFQLVEVINIPLDFNYRTYEVNFSDFEGINGYIAIKIQGGRDDFKTINLDNFQFSSNLPFNCSDNITFPYKSELVTYGTVYRNGLCWLDRNLGANRVPNIMIDNEGYGDLFQWGRLDDGHQSRTSNTVVGPTASYIPGHSDFITATWIYGNWLSPPNFELWQGAGGLNNPCPDGWRLPIANELVAEKNSWSESNITGAFQSTLKWPASGIRDVYGNLIFEDERFYIWSSTQGGPGQSEPQLLVALDSYTGIGGSSKANGFSVRCVRETLPPSKKISLIILLEGAFNGADGLHTSLKSSGLLPLSQPYNTAPWNYSGNETVTVIPQGVVDWVLVELRDAATPETATAATKLAGWPKAMFLKSDGSIAGLDGALPQIGNPVVNNNLYLVIRHRNHLDVMSATPLVLSGNTYSYDFTDDITKVYGGAAGYKSLGNGKFGMVAGDIDADGSVSVLDFSSWATAFGASQSYNNADTDLDGQVSVLDFSRWAVNFGVENPINGLFQIKYQSQIPK